MPAPSSEGYGPSAAAVPGVLGTGPLVLRATGQSRLLGTWFFLMGLFFVGTLVVGLLAERGWTAQSIWKSVSAMMVGHAITLGIGVSWLATHHGWATAWQSGLEPFLAGALVKSLLASGTVEVLRRVMGSRRGSSEGLT